MFIKSIKIKVGKMRKPDSCVVYPKESDSSVLFVQGSRLAMLVDIESGKAIFNYSHGSSYPNRFHCQRGIKGVQADILSKELIDQIKECIPNSGDCIGSTVCKLK